MLPLHSVMVPRRIAFWDPLKTCAHLGPLCRAIPWEPVTRPHCAEPLFSGLRRAKGNWFSSSFMVSYSYPTSWRADVNGKAPVYLNGSLLSFTVRVEVWPGGSLIWLEATLPDSTHTMRSYSSLPKSGICCALAVQGFHTTVEAEPFFST